MQASVVNPRAFSARVHQSSSEALHRLWLHDHQRVSVGASRARWLRSHDAAVLGSDVDRDVMPSGIDEVRMPIHLLTLASIGMPILDNLDLERVANMAAEQHRWVFLMNLAPEPVPGGNGSPVNPTAIF